MGVDKQVPEASDFEADPSNSKHDVSSLGPDAAAQPPPPSHHHESLDFNEASALSRGSGPLLASTVSAESRLFQPSSLPFKVADLKALVTDESWLAPLQSPKGSPGLFSRRPSTAADDLTVTSFPAMKSRMEITEDEEIEEIAGGHNAPFNNRLDQQHSSTLSPARPSSSATEASLLVRSQPRLSFDSPEVLLTNFDQHTCGILSVRDGPYENPWRVAIWPIAHEFPALRHAILSMSAFHASRSRPEMKVPGCEHMGKSIQNLSKGLGLGNMPQDVALATSLALAFAVSWDVHISTGIQHLRGGKELANEALKMVQQKKIADPARVARIKFLCNTWLYMDVIARLTSLDVEERAEIDMRLWSQIDPFGTSDEIDPLMGCATTLFPIIGRAANLVQRVRRSVTNSISIVSDARELKEELMKWQPRAYLNKPADPTCDIEDSIQTAEAYRWATLLYLHQAVPEIPSRTSAQLAQKVLIYLATVPLTSRTTIVHIYPLLAAGCEASHPEDREFVRDRWVAMSQRMQIGNVEKCCEVVRAVWERRDEPMVTTIRSRQESLVPRMGNLTFSSVLSELTGSNPLEADEPCGTLLGNSGHTMPEETVIFHGMPPALGAIESSRTSRKRNFSSSSAFPEPQCQTSPKPRRGSGRFKMRHHPLVDLVETVEDIGFERTVRGREHWVGVMKDWKWEGTCCSCLFWWLFCGNRAQTLMENECSPAWITILRLLTMIRSVGLAQGAGLAYGTHGNGCIVTDTFGPISCSHLIMCCFWLRFLYF